jgi:hypothetical protein
MKFIIWSEEHKGYWKPNSMGYTNTIENAGRYDVDEAIQICAGANAYGSICEMMFPEPMR